MVRLGVLVAVFLLAFGAWRWSGLPRLPAKASAAPPDLVLPGKVLRVGDGDGIDVQLDSGRVRVRLYGIDAPELNGPYGRQAKQALESLLGGRDVDLLPVEQDAFDRLVAVVLLEGRSINETMIDQGQAWANRRYLGQLDGDDRYCDLEAGARAERRGLWAQPTSEWLPPWVYRARAAGRRGPQVADRDYSGETAADCKAAVQADRRSARRGARPPKAGCVIKGNIGRDGARIYHLPGSRAYAATRIDEKKGERWFCTVEEARAAGWREPR